MMDNFVVISLPHFSYLSSFVMIMFLPILLLLLRTLGLLSLHSLIFLHVSFVKLFPLLPGGLSLVIFKFKMGLFTCHNASFLPLFSGVFIFPFFFVGFNFSS